MAQVDRRRKKKTNKDFIILILLVLIIFSLILYILFSKMDSKDDTTRKNFLVAMQSIQSELSYYICGMEKDTFGIYTKLEILAGRVEDNEAEQTTEEGNEESSEDEVQIDTNVIKDNEGNQITSLIETDKNYGTDENPIYKVNVTDLQKVLNVNVQEFEGLDFYIESGTIIKVGFQHSKPSWWNDNFDVFTIN